MATNDIEKVAIPVLDTSFYMLNSELEVYGNL